MTDLRSGTVNAAASKWLLDKYERLLATISDWSVEYEAMEIRPMFEVFPDHNSRDCDLCVAERQRPALKATS